MSSSLPSSKTIGCFLTLPALLSDAAGDYIGCEYFDSLRPPTFAVP
jgi:hypothetical protein